MTELLSQFVTEARKFTDRGLEEYLPPADAFPESIHKSMRYSTLAEGKRIRPALALAAYELCGGPPGNEGIRQACCALEMLHAFSLIHDDLPCMDDDDFRRGKPTNHRVFGEAVAVLGGDALCIHAFALLGLTGHSQIVTEVAESLGTDGMIGGQVVDIESEGSEAGKQTLEYIHTHKTGALIRTCLRVGALLANAEKSELEALSQYGENIGLAFQVADDVLDVEGTTRQLGKDAGSDEQKGKVTYPAVVGLAESKALADRLVGQAKSALACFGPKADLLRDVADYIVEREK